MPILTGDVLALVTDAYGGRGGIAQYNRDFLDALARLPGVRSVVITPRHAPGPVRLPSVRLKQLPARPGRFSYLLAVCCYASTHRIDTIFCGHLHLAPLAALLARAKGARLVIQTHGIEAWDKPSQARRTALEAADLVLSVSRYTRAMVLTWADISPERVHVLPNTVSDGFTPGDGAALRAEWGLERNRVLLTVARLDSRERYKGHDRVITAMAGFPSSMQDVVYVIAGEGDDRARLEALARNAGLQSRVRFVGAVPRKTLIEAYRMADLFVMPSTGEGFGIAFIEAMACGTPALGLADGGARDALADGELGIIATEKDLPETIVRILSDPTDGVDLAKRVRNRFGLEVFQKRVGLALDQWDAAA